MSTDASATPTPPNSDELAREFAQIVQHSQKIASDFLQRAQEGKAAMPSDDVGVANAFMELGAKLLSNPMQLAEAQMRMWHDYMRLWHSTLARAMGEKPAPVADAKADNRFKNEAWQNNFLFDYIKQSYLIAARNIHEAVAGTEGLSDKRIYPAINIDRSGTRKEELIYHPEEMLRVYGLRRAMQGIPPVEAMDMLIQRLKKTKTNAEFLLSLNR